jgi:hypothetical protein
MSNEKQQTAVEWLEMELKKLPLIDVLKTFEKAKQMHKEEIEVAYESSHLECNKDKFGFEYYNETYGGNNE